MGSPWETSTPPAVNPEEPLSYQHMPAIAHKPEVNIEVEKQDESQRLERLEGQ